METLELPAIEEQEELAPWNEQAIDLDFRHWKEGGVPEESPKPKEAPAKMIDRAAPGVEEGAAPEAQCRPAKGR
jgi:hypothetical protein